MKSPISNFKYNQGFTMVELLLVMGIFTVLSSIATVSLAKFERNASLSSEVNTIIPDLKEQQIKAMAGDGEGSGSINNYGVHITATSYTLFQGTYVAGNSSNLVVTLPANIQLSTTFPSSEILFAKGSGEVTGPNTLTLTDMTNSHTKTITINKYGVITSIN
jgi:prepilin-type N-terminal cleavage/methylation domain-containing protein